MKARITLLLIGLAASLSMSAEPDKLIKLRSTYEAATERALAPLRKTYLQELEKLKTEMTKAAKLEEALSVSEEIKRLTSASAPPDSRNEASSQPSEAAPRRLRQFKTTDDMTAWLTGTIWVSETASIPSIHFLDKNHFAWFDKKLGRENVGLEFTPASIGILTFKYSNGAASKIEIADDLKEIQFGGQKYKLQKK